MQLLSLNSAASFVEAEQEASAAPASHFCSVLVFSTGLREDDEGNRS